MSSSIAQALVRLADLFGGNQNAQGNQLSNRNLFVDGNFENWINASTVVAQPSTANTGAVMYVFGQSSTAGSPAGTATYSKGVWPAGTEPLGMTSPMSGYLLINQTVANNSPGYTSNSGGTVYQRIESVRTLQGRSATFSCWLWIGAGQVTIPAVLARQNFGTGGSPSANVTLDVPTNWTVTTTPQRFSVRIDFPTINGKTLGTAGNDYLYVGLWLPNGVTYSLGTSQWQLEQSNPNSPATGSPTAFEYRGPQAELARVQRYYNTTVTHFGGGYTSTGLGISCNHQWPVMMRSPPTVAFTGGSYSNASGITAINPNQYGMRVQAVVTATGSGGFFDFVVTADARL